MRIEDVRPGWYGHDRHGRLLYVDRDGRGGPLRAFYIHKDSGTFYTPGNVAKHGWFVDDERHAFQTAYRLSNIAQLLYGV